MIKIGIVGGAGYTAGELLRLLLFHPEAEVTFVHSESHAGQAVTAVHEGLFGDTDLHFSSTLLLEGIDVLFLCLGHGKSQAFLAEHKVPHGVKIIDLAQDFRLLPTVPLNEGEVVDVPTPQHHDFVYGLPEFYASTIRTAHRVANPGCFATCLQLALLPAATQGWLTQPVSINAITGATGAGVKPSATTHFAWRTDNVSVYKAFRHQHIPEICQTLSEAQGNDVPELDFIPYRGAFARGIFATAVVRLPQQMETEMVQQVYREFYHGAAFTYHTEQPLDLKQVVNTNKALVHTEVIDNKLLITACIDNLLKGAVGQAVQNMNLMMGLDERMGLMLKASAF